VLYGIKPVLTHASCVFDILASVESVKSVNTPEAIKLGRSVFAARHVVLQFLSKARKCSHYTDDCQHCVIAV